MARRLEVQDRELTLRDGSTLAWSVGVPETDVPVPLVIALHWGWVGELPPRQGRDFLRVFAETAFGELGCAIVSPNCPGRSWRQERSEGAVLELREHALATLPVDPERVLLTGFSLGGMGTWFLGCRHPELFAAAVPVAAVPVVDRGDSAHSGLTEFLERSEAGEAAPWHDGLTRIPFHAVNSRADELIPFEPVREAVEALRRRGADLEFLALEEVGHYQAIRFAGAMSPVRDWLARVWGR